MHEISIAVSIIQIAECKAHEQGARSVQVIKLRLGTFTTIVAESLQFAFEVARLGTLAQNARLDIEIVPMVVHCVVCNASTKPAGGICLICEHCGFPLEIVSGEELQIEYIEVDFEGEDHHGTSAGTNFSADQCIERQSASGSSESRALHREPAACDESYVRAGRG